MHDVFLDGDDNEIDALFADGSIEKRGHTNVLSWDRKDGTH